MHDLVIADGMLIDGTGAPGRPSDVGITGSTILALGPPGTISGRRRIGAEGMVVAPGFIDPHTHLDAMLLAEPDFEPGLRQGITTIVLGSDGCGYAPASAPTLAFFRSSIAGFSGNPPQIGWDWSSVAEYLARFDDGHVAPNVAFLVPFGCLRAEVVGLDDRPASPRDRAAMAELARRAMTDGAVGFSWGYNYPPNTYGSVTELATVAEAIGPDGVFASHMRDYEKAIDASLEEAFEVGRASGIRVHISHLNMHWEQGVPPIDAGRGAGLDVSFDIYPYLAGSTVLTRSLPEWTLVGGTDEVLARLEDPEVRARIRSWLIAPERRWESTLLGSIGSERYTRHQGRSPLEAAAEEGQPIDEFVCDLLVASGLEVGVIGFRHHRQNEDDLRRFLGHGHVVVASDGIFVGRNPHPRGFGAFARILRQYVREEGLLTLEAAIERMTSRTARIFGLGDRGVVAVGRPADLVIFDPARIADRSTYENGRELAAGVEAVLVGGRPALLDGRLTGDFGGRVLRGPRSELPLVQAPRPGPGGVSSEP